LLTARDPNKGNEAANNLVDKEGWMDVIFHLLDVINKDHIKVISEQVEKLFGRLDVLVNNAASKYQWK
jgi:NAD(P)-dependent dehydrogenase (short-subunit alcohol dehydrogenase family)